mmetsp:Transcript_106626/g.299595  ORF Transcript_106626/g.299595 Transcript_106626/m.299595 type:complete len:80 (+) Transcript_106626:3-242(+)
MRHSLPNSNKFHTPLSEMATETFRQPVLGSVWRRACAFPTNGPSTDKHLLRVSKAAQQRRRGVPRVLQTSALDHCLLHL